MRGPSGSKQTPVENGEEKGFSGVSTCPHSPGTGAQRLHPCHMTGHLPSWGHWEPWQGLGLELPLVGDWAGVIRGLRGRAGSPSVQTALAPSLSECVLFLGGLENAAWAAPGRPAPPGAPVSWDGRQAEAPGTQSHGPEPPWVSTAPHPQQTGGADGRPRHAEGPRDAGRLGGLQLSLKGLRVPARPGRPRRPRCRWRDPHPTYNSHGADGWGQTPRPSAPCAPNCPTYSQELEAREETGRARTLQRPRSTHRWPGRAIEGSGPVGGVARTPRSPEPTGPPCSSGRTWPWRCCPLLRPAPGDTTRVAAGTLRGPSPERLVRADGRPLHPSESRAGAAVMWPGAKGAGHSTETGGEGGILT